MDADEYQRLIKLLKKARSALKPFAVAAEYLEPEETDDFSLANSSARHELAAGHLYGAKSAHLDLDYALQILEAKNGQDRI